MTRLLLVAMLLSCPLVAEYAPYCTADSAIPTGTGYGSMQCRSILSADWTLNGTWTLQSVAEPTVLTKIMPTGIFAYNGSAVLEFITKDSGIAYTDGTHSTEILFASPSGDAQVTVPNTTGTLALTSDIPAHSDTTLANAYTAGNFAGTETITPGALTVNDAGADIDTRIEGDADPNLLYLDAGNDRVGIGTNVPQAKLEMITPNSSTLGSGLNLGMRDTAGTDEYYYQIGFGYSAPSLPPGVIAFQEKSDAGYTNGDFVFALRTDTANSAPTERLRIRANGEVVPVALIIPNGAHPAATCTVGEVFIDTDETDDTNCTTTADNSICICTATNTWTALENN